METAKRKRAIAAIQHLFGSYRAAQPGDRKLLVQMKDGKLYEMYVLSWLIGELVKRGFSVRFVGSQPGKGGAAASHSTLKFKGGPGKIKTSDSHFLIHSPALAQPLYLFLNIEFDTLGHHHSATSDNSRRHELDIIVTTCPAGYPRHDQILLGVECKAVANFQKDLLKQALGVRRELSYYGSGLNLSSLSNVSSASPVFVNAFPASEFLVVFTDPKGLDYADSPKGFGIDFHHLDP